MKGLILTFFTVMSLTFMGRAQGLTLQDGLYTDENGALYSGEVTLFHENGEMKTNFFVEDGMIQHVALFYDINGRLIMSGSYTENTKDGLWLSYDGKGKVSSKAEYRRGKKIGEWVIKSPYSDLTYNLYYANNELLSAFVAE